MRGLLARPFKPQEFGQITQPRAFISLSALEKASRRFCRCGGGRAEFLPCSGNTKGSFPVPCKLVISGSQQAQPHPRAPGASHSTEHVQIVRIRLVCLQNTHKCLISHYPPRS